MDTGEEAINAELEGLDITACREKIAQLQAERERRRESTERLQEKLKALNYELAARKEELDRQRRWLNEQSSQNRHDETQLRALGPGAGGGQGGAVAVVPADEDVDQESEQVRRFVEERLTAAMPRKPPVNELGIRTFDERDLMVEKPAGERKNASAYVDTVLITHCRSSSSEHKYHLSYRVGRDTKVRKLREDACLYWGISEVEYILWTQNGAKVHDDLAIQSCFSPGEDAHLILMPKVPKKTAPDERILEAIRPKMGAKARQKKKAAAATDPQQATAEAQGGNLFEQMSAVPGLFESMTQRDDNVTSHTKRIWPCSCCLYLLLALGTVTSVAIMKPPNKEYLCRLGIYTAMTSDTRQPFYKIRSEDEAWDWLTEVAADQLFVNSSNMRRTNYLPGWVRIRMQQVRNATHEACPMKTGLSPEILCYDEYYNAETLGSEDLEEVKSYWQNKSAEFGRANNTVPWRFMTNEEGEANNVATQDGMFQSFDASGYAVDYNLQYSNLTDLYHAYTEDMEALRAAGWISDRTRAVHLSFTAYNGNYDYWVTNWYLLEMPTSGVVVPSSDVDLFRPVRDELDNTMGVALLGIDTTRFVLVLFILCYQIPREVRHERSKRETATMFRYLAGPMGLTDLAIVGLGTFIYIVRWVDGSRLDFAAVTRSDRHTAGFSEESTHAYYYRENIVLEAFLLTLVVFRFGKFMRLNRQIYLVWQTVNRSMQRYCRFLLVFAPVLASYIVLGHAIWRVRTPMYRTYWSSATSTVMILLGDLTAMRMDAAETRVWTMVYSLGLYGIIVLLFVNSWIAVLVAEYQKTRVRRGWRPEEYAWQEYQYVEWILPQRLASIYFKYIRKGIKPRDDDDDDA